MFLRALDRFISISKHSDNLLQRKAREPEGVAIIGNAVAPMVGFRSPLIRSMLDNGHTVYALAPDYCDATREMVWAMGAIPVSYRLARTGLNPLADLMSLISLCRSLHSIQPRTVLSFGIKPAIYGTFASRVVGAPSRFALITGLGYAFTDGAMASLKRRVVRQSARLLYRFGLSFADCVFMQNPDDVDEFVRMGIVPRDKTMTVNGTGVKLSEWPPAPPVTSPVTFLLAARMLRDKGIFEFVKAAEIVRATHPDARFVLVGSIDSNPEAIEKERLISWVESGLVEWPGHVEMRSWLSKTSVFVLPSYREGVPRSTQEAMAMARPIITTDAPGCRETVLEGRNGYLVPVRDADALAVAMRRFLVDTSLIAKMGRESRALAEERFDTDKVNSVMMGAMRLLRS